MIDWTEIPDGESWEQFARDFLSELGFVVDIAPGRGTDGGMDLIVSEQMRGNICSRKFTWLVSCKHYAKGGKAVGTNDETNITDRLAQHRADGFLGFYSTTPSSSLIERLRSLQIDGKISGWQIFDGSRITGKFLHFGLPKLAYQYIPISYRKMRPLQTFLGQHLELACKSCGKDVLRLNNDPKVRANVLFCYKINEPSECIDIHICCKGQCDEELEKILYRQQIVTSWEDINDLMNPILYLKSIMAYMNNLHASPKSYTDEAHKKIKHMYMALAQKTLREPTKDDEQRYRDLAEFDL